MATSTDSERLVVFKHIETGLAALIIETADVLKANEWPMRDYDPDTCRYELENDEHCFIFARRPRREDVPVGTQALVGAHRDKIIKINGHHNAWVYCYSGHPVSVFDNFEVVPS